MHLRLIGWLPLAFVTITVEVFLERTLRARLHALRALIASIYADNKRIAQHMHTTKTMAEANHGARVVGPLDISGEQAEAGPINRSA